MNSSAVCIFGKEISNCLFYLLISVTSTIGKKTFPILKNIIHLQGVADIPTTF